MGNRTTIDSAAVRRNRWLSERRRRCQAETASITTAPVSSDARMTWMYPQMKTGFVITSPIELSSGRPVASSVVYPTGFCIQELAAMMNAADSIAPIATSQIVAR